MSFVKELWESVFEPGTNAALVKATHGSFACLLVTLIGLFGATRNMHFVAMLVLASGLWASVTWFINEMEAAKKRQAMGTGDSDQKTQAGKTSGGLTDDLGTSTAAKQSTNRRSRKA